MVVVVRSTLVAPAGARPAASAFATLYETLVMMAAGGFLAGAGLGLGRMVIGADPGPHAGLARWHPVAASLAALILASPPGPDSCSWSGRASSRGWRG